MSKETQLLIYNKIKDFYDCRMIINEKEPFVLFCGRDIGKILGIKNLNENLKNNSDKYLLLYESKGGKQKTFFIDYNILLKILIKSRKSTVIDFSKKIGINLESKIFSCIEADTIKCIVDSFSGEIMINQYKIGDYFLDLYFQTYNLVIECDENKHKLNKIHEKDIIRELNLKNLLKNCEFIRYNPEEKDFNIFNVINKIFKFIQTANSRNTT